MQKTIKTNYDQLAVDFKKKVDSTKADLVQKMEVAQKKMPDLAPVLADYTSEGKKLYAEVQADPTLKHICDIL